jgi:trans-aconitate methyltransferase
MTGWSEIWKNRSCNSADPRHVLTLEDLLRVNGYDTGTGKITSEDFEEYARSVTEICKIQTGDSLFEVGMGGGAFLLPWYRAGHPVGGLDYSAALVSIARAAMPDARHAFLTGEASRINTRKKYDVVLSNGVFLYFPDMAYARTVLEKMIKKSRKTIAILDIPDMAQQEITEKFRRASLPPGEYEERYRGLDHLYFPRSWFHEIADAGGLTIRISDQHIPHYANSRFRFNVVMKK